MQLQPLVKYRSDRTWPVEWWVEVNTSRTRSLLIAKGQYREELIEILLPLVFGVYLNKKGYEVS